MCKRLIALLLAMCLLLTLVACGSKTEEAPEEEPAVEEGTIPEDEAVTGEDVIVDVETITPEGEETESPRAEHVPADPQEKPEAGNVPVKPQEEKPEAKPVQKPQENVPAETPEVEAPAVEGVDLNAFYLSQIETYGENFPATMNLCDSVEMLDSFYPGLSAISARQRMIYQPMMGAVVCEIALVEVSNSADVDAVKAIFQARIDAQVEGGAWYPESIEGWKNTSRVVANGNCVMMIAYSECDAVVDAFNGLFA